jgi:hypothetical protein
MVAATVTAAVMVRPRARRTMLRRREVAENEIRLLAMGSAS